MAELTYRAAIAAGIAQEMERDPSVVLIGEDVGAAGGVFKLTEGLFDEFGPERVRDTPISEQAIVGAAMGAAMTGLRPIAELMFSDFFAVTWDMVVNQIAKTRYMTDGQVSLPLVLRTANGAGLRFGAQHSQSIENWAMAIPGLKVVAPVDPGRRGGLLAAAVRDPGPGHRLRAQGAVRGQGRGPRRRASSTRSATARIVRRAPTLTIVALAAMVPKAVEAAERLAAEHGIDAEVIDLRSLVPLDTATILASVAEDEPAVHGRGEPAAVRLGRGDRLDRRRRGLLQPRRADRPDHDPAHPAAVGVRARGPRDPVGRAHRRHHQATPRRGARERRESWLSRPSPSSAPAGWARRWPSAWRAGVAGRRLQPDRRTRARDLADRIGATRRRPPRPRRVAGADVVISMVADDDAVDAVYGGPDGVIAGPRRAARVAVDMSTVLPDTIRAIAPAVRARGAGVLDAPVSGSVGSAESGQLTIMVGGEAADLERARPVLDALRARDLPPRPAGYRGGDEARREHAHLRAQRRHRRGPRPRRAERHRAGARPTTCSPPARPARRSSSTSGRPSSSRTTTPVAFSLELADEGPATHRRAGRGIRDADAAGRDQSPGDPRRRTTSSGGDADFAELASHLREEGRR